LPHFLLHPFPTRRSSDLLPFPEEYGGVGAGDLGYCLALEQFGRTSAAFSNIIGAHTSIGSMSIFLGGTEDQKRRYLPDLAAGKRSEEHTSELQSRTDRVC